MLLKKFKTKIRYIKITHSGKPAVARNVGLKVAQGDLISFQDSDDLWEIDKLNKQVPLFDDPDVVMAGPRITHPAGDLQTAGIRTWHSGGSAGGEEIKEDLPTRDVDGPPSARRVLGHGQWRS